jgi:hypothetical protein
MTPDDYNQKQMDESLVEGEHVTKLTELWQDTHFLTVDGKCGPETRESILGDSTVDPGEPPTNPGEPPPFDGPIGWLPKNRREVYEVFGDPSNGTKVDKKWEKANIRTYRKAMALPGVDPHRYVKLHRLAEPYVREALRRAQEVSDYNIITFGAYNFRLIRGVNRLSYHSWGIAFDINPAQNPAIRYDSPADKPVPFSEEWHAIRPHAMDKPFVDAIKSVGFGWGGDWRTFADDMHFELVMP